MNPCPLTPEKFNHRFHSLAMAPELFIALIALAVFAGIVAFAWIWTSDPARQPSARAEEQRLTGYIAWLETRLQLARREGWEQTLEEQIAEQLAANRAQLAALRANLRSSSTNVPVAARSESRS